MKTFSQVFASVLVVAVTSAIATAAPMVSIDQSGDSFAISLVTDDVDNMFNTIIAEILPAAPNSFVNFDADGVDGAPLGPGADASFINALMAAPSAFGGLGYTLIDGGTANVSASGAGGIGFNAGPLGANITSQDPIFLSNVVLPTGGAGSYSIQLVDTGNVLATLSGTFGGQVVIPEPGTLLMASLGLIGFAGCRRRRS